MKQNTALLHQRFRGDAATGATLAPIAQVSAFSGSSAEELEQVFAGRKPGFAYTRIGNPTISSFEQRIAGLEGGVSATACASGMAAVSMALLNVLEQGDEVIAAAGLYGGTLNLFSDLTHFGIRTHFVERLIPELVEPLINQHTKVIFGEVISNPKLDVVDIGLIADCAHRHGLPLFIDNTTATPILVHPLALGADIVIHSSSKYLNGSGSAISGILVDGGKFPWDFQRYPALKGYRQLGKLAFTARLRNDTWQNFGPCAAPMNLFLNSIGLETLGLRMERLCSNARGLAEYLSRCLGPENVNYPGLESSPCYSLVQSQLNGMGGAILTARLGTKERAYRVMNALKYATIASNIGDVRTLILHPSSTIFVHSSPEEKRRAGVYEDMLRVSVGIEDLEDLMEDFELGFGKAGG